MGRGARWPASASLASAAAHEADRPARCHDQRGGEAVRPRPRGHDLAQARWERCPRPTTAPDGQRARGAYAHGGRADTVIRPGSVPLADPRASKRDGPSPGPRRGDGRHVSTSATQRGAHGPQCRAIPAIARRPRPPPAFLGRSLSVSGRPRTWITRAGATTGPGTPCGAARPDRIDGRAARYAVAPRPPRSVWMGARLIRRGPGIPRGWWRRVTTLRASTSVSGRPPTDTIVRMPAAVRVEVGQRRHHPTSPGRAG
jgi:hypothetical protein